MSETKKISRAKLYEMVWSTPMVKLAKEFGLSDVGLRKKCKKINIPLPKQGYWQKKQFADSGPPPPLPNSDGPEEVLFACRSEEEEIKSRPVDEEQLREATQKIAFEKLTENRIRVPKALRSMHPLIEQARNTLEKIKICKSGSDNGLLKAGNKKCLDIQVSPKNLSRALRIMNTLIKELEGRGLEVFIDLQKEGVLPAHPSTYISVLGERIEIRLRELLKMRQKEDIARERERNWWNGGGSNYQPTGRIVLEIMNWNAPRKNWIDGRFWPK